VSEKSENGGCAPPTPCATCGGAHVGALPQTPPGEGIDPLPRTPRSWRVYAHVSQAITVYVDAPSADMALGNARERLAVDRSPSQYRTVSQPTEIGEWEREQFGVEEVSRVRDGRLLTPGEIAYCQGRGYVLGYDIDSFHGLQWHHLVDDSVALCRTMGLWGSGGRVKDGERVSCPFCLDILHAEMRDPHLSLQIYSRHNGNHGVAELDTTDLNGDAVLKVNGVEVVRAKRTVGHNPNEYDVAFGEAYEKIMDLREAINKAAASRAAEEFAAHRSVNRPAPSLREPPVKLLKDGDYRRRAYITRALAFHETKDAYEKKRLDEELCELLRIMTEAERADVEGYFRWHNDVDES
jgi:hypothetical protein